MTVTKICVMMMIIINVMKRSPTKTLSSKPSYKVKDWKWCLPLLISFHWISMVFFSCSVNVYQSMDSDHPDIQVSSDLCFQSHRYLYAWCREYKCTGYPSPGGKHDVRSRPLPTLKAWSCRTGTSMETLIIYQLWLFFAAVIGRVSVQKILIILLQKY